MIIYEDDLLLVVNKPAGMTVNRSDTTLTEITLQDWIDEYFHRDKNKRYEVREEDSEDELISSDFRNRSGIVHRIDKETSGILLIAKTEEAFIFLQSQFKERVVKKSYIALAHGRVVPEEGEIRVPVGRLPWNRRQFGVVAGGREALSLYKVMGYYRTTDKRKEPVSLLDVQPFTGRTHQIRVHLQYLGHPIFSDFLYAGRKTQREDRKYLERVFLHAAEISFLHPKTKKEVHFTASLPQELQSVVDTLVPTV